jgi:glycosyltransferase involved in cell wall biosynthesis
MTRVLVFNNYSLENVLKEVNKKDKPDHHLYGINYFYERGYDVEIVSYKNSKILCNLNQSIKKINPLMPLGDLDQAWSAFKELNESDLIYSPCQTQTQLFTYARAMGWLKIPVVRVAHHKINRGRLSLLRAPFVKLSVKGTDIFPSLSSRVANEISVISRQPQKSFPIPWGPDAKFYSRSSNLGDSIVAAGRTGRDFRTFCVAASRTRVPVQIICLQKDARMIPNELGDNVRLSIEQDTDYMKYPELLEFYAQARAIAIPMYVVSDSLCGLTSLMDAMGMGKPIIMTRHPLIDIDIEKEGIGKWVAPGDIQGWREAIQFFEDNEDEAWAMGQKARKLVDAGMNSKSFANQVMDIFDRVLACSKV